MTIKKILITGSSGTIGTRLCEKLLELNYEIIGLDLKPNTWNKKINELTLIWDLCDTKTLENLPENIDMVIHLAANVRIYESVINPNLAKENYEMLFNILEFCRLSSIKKIIFASSREVYGNTDEIIYSEDQVGIKNCESNYTASKIGGEALIQSYKKCYNIDFIILRFSSVYGMYDDKDRVIPLFIKSVKEGKDIFVYGEDKLLDFTYINDAVSGVLKSIEKFEEVKNEIFNIASGKGTKIIEVAKLVLQHLNQENRIIIKEKRKGEIVKFVVDLSKARNLSDYLPATSISEGIKKSIEWYKNNKFTK